MLHKPVTGAYITQAVLQPTDWVTKGLCSYKATPEGQVRVPWTHEGRGGRLAARPARTPACQRAGAAARS